METLVDIDLAEEQFKINLDGSRLCELEKNNPRYCALLKSDLNFFNKYKMSKIKQSFKDIFDAIFCLKKYHIQFRDADALLLLSMFSKEVFEFGVKIFKINKLDRGDLMSVACCFNNLELFEYHYNECLKKRW